MKFYIYQIDNKYIILQLSIKTYLNNYTFMFYFNFLIGPVKYIYLCLHIYHMIKLHWLFWVIYYTMTILSSLLLINNIMESCWLFHIIHHILLLSCLSMRIYSIIERHQMIQLYNMIMVFYQLIKIYNIIIILYRSLHILHIIIFINKLLLIY